jgi:hypothetical protein
MADIDLDRIATLLGIAGTSDFDGERINAVRLADRALRTENMTWLDLFTPFREHAVAVEAARVLLSENEQLQAENEQLRAAAGQSTAVAMWSDVGSPQRQARWCLRERGAHRLYLNEFEEDGGGIGRAH